MRKIALILLTVLVCHNLASSESINGNNVRHGIDINGVNIPNTHALEMNEPVAMYCSSTDVIEITFDSNCYSHYTIQLEGM